MTREGALLVTVAFAIVLLAVLVWAWRRRVRRDAGLEAPFGDLPPQARVQATIGGLYVATTRHDEPLERLAVRGLDFRSRATLLVTDHGVALDVPAGRLFLDRDTIVAVDQATVAIDRVVEPGGLVRLVWTTGDGTVVDSYFRAQETSARAVVDALNATPPTPTGADA